MYVAIGFGRDKRNLQGMDVSACYKEGCSREQFLPAKSDLLLPQQTFALRHLSVTKLEKLSYAKWLDLQIWCRDQGMKYDSATTM